MLAGTILMSGSTAVPSPHGSLLLTILTMMTTTQRWYKSPLPTLVPVTLDLPNQLSKSPVLWNT
jgi:hypothetical protein